MQQITTHLTSDLGSTTAYQDTQGSAEAEIESLRESLKMLMQTYTESQRNRSQVQESMLKLQSGLKSEMGKMQEETTSAAAESSE